MLVRLTTAWPEAALPQLAQPSAVEIRADRHGEANLATNSALDQILFLQCFHDAHRFPLKSTFMKIKLNLLKLNNKMRRLTWKREMAV